MRKVIPILVASAAAVLLVAGCGGKGGSTSTTSTVDWANSLCTAITTWRTSVNSAVDSVQSGNVSKSSLQGAADQVESATETFVDAIKSLGKPGTEAGSQAEQSLDELSTEVDAEQQKINTAISGVTTVSGVISAAPVVLGSLQTMRTDISTTFRQLQSLDASGELSDAFNQASACSTLKKST
jgi:hypothetical protein